MNEDVLKMIETLHARLYDLESAVESLPGEAPQYVKKLDKIDDALYLLQCEVEKEVAGATCDGDAEADAVDDDVESTDAKPAKKKEGEFLSEEMKGNLVDAGRAIGSVLRDGKEVVTEISDTVGDLKGVFSFKKR